MANQNLNIDELFLRGLAGYSEVPPTAVWNALEKRLETGKGRPYGWWWMVLILMVTGTGAYLGKDLISFATRTANGKTISNEISDAHQNTAPALPATIPDINNTTATITTTSNKNTTTTTNDKVNNYSSTSTNNTSVNNTTQPRDNNTSTTPPNPNIIAAATTDKPKKKTTIVTNDTTAPQATTALMTPTKQLVKEKIADVNKKPVELTRENTQTPAYNTTPHNKELIKTTDTAIAKKEQVATTPPIKKKDNNIPVVTKKNDPAITPPVKKKDNNIPLVTKKNESIVTPIVNDKNTSSDNNTAQNTKKQEPIANKQQDKPTANTYNTNTSTPEKKEPIQPTTSTPIVQKKATTLVDSPTNTTGKKPVTNTFATNKKVNTPVVNKTTAPIAQVQNNIAAPIVPQSSSISLENKSGKTGTDVAQLLQGIKDGNMPGNSSHPIRYQMGVKAAYAFGTQAFSINSLILSLYFQFDLTKNMAIQFAPGLRINGTGGGPFKQPETFISPYTTILDTTTHGTWNVSNYTHSFDSITKKHSLEASRTTEVELPLILKYKVGNNFYVFAGPVFIIGNVVAITTTTDSVHGSPLSGIDSVAAPAYLGAANVYAKYHTSPLYSSYDGSQYQNPSSTSMRIGLMLGLNYNPDDRLGIYLSLQPNLSDLGFIPNNTIRSLYSQTYIRVGVSYRLFGSKN